MRAEELADSLGGKRSGKGWKARCPAHDDGTPSLSIAEGDNGATLLYCQAGCELDNVLAALGLTLKDLAPPTFTPNGHDETSYRYTDATGTLLFEVVRQPGKKFHQRPANGRRGAGAMEGVPLVLYNLPRVLKAVVNGATVVITEGEKDADRVVAEGYCATCNPMGAGKWGKVAEHAREVLAGADVLVIRDRDDAGRKHAAEVADSLRHVTSSLLLADIAIHGHANDKKDVSDHLAAGLTIEQLLEVADDGEGSGQSSSTDEDVVPTALMLARSVPSFPTSALASWQAEYVTALAEATQTPADLAAVIVLCCTAAAAGGRAVVEARPGWVEPLNIFGAVGMPPGSRKSAVFAAATTPLLHTEKDLTERTAADISEATARRAIADAAASKIAQRAAAADEGQERDDLTAEAIAAALMAEAIVVPTKPRLLADDATVEAVGSLLAQQGGRLALMSPEGDVFEVMAGKYNAAPMISVFLKAHSGDSLRVDRKGRDAEYVERPALTIAATVQPAVIERLSRTEGFRGRGLLARFLWSVPPTNMGTRSSTAPAVPTIIETTYTENMATLVLTLAEWTDPAIMALDPDAHRLLIQVMEELEPRLGPKGDLYHVADWAGKWAGAIVRIAGLIHLSTHYRDGWKRPITATTMASAISVGRYFLQHALAVFDMMGADPNRIKADKVSRWMAGRELITRRDVHAAFRSDFPLAADVDPVLELLEDHGWIKRAPDPPRDGAGRPPSPSYIVNRRAT